MGQNSLEDGDNNGLVGSQAGSPSRMDPHKLNNIGAHYYVTTGAAPEQEAASNLREAYSQGVFDPLMARRLSLNLPEQRPKDINVENVDTPKFQYEGQSADDFTAQAEPYGGT